MEAAQHPPVIGVPNQMVAQRGGQPEDCDEPRAQRLVVAQGGDQGVGVRRRIEQPPESGQRPVRVRRLSEGIEQAVVEPGA